MTALEQIVRKLTQRTAQGAVQWKIVGLENTLRASFGKFTVIVARDLVRIGYVYRVSVLNEDGVTADSASTLESDARIHGDLKGLYETAKRSVRKTDETLNELLAILDAEG